MAARKAHFYDRDNQMRVTLSGLPDSATPCVRLNQITATATWLSVLLRLRTLLMMLTAATGRQST